MFRLLRYFSLTSAVALGLTAALLTYFYYQDRIHEHTERAKAENARLATAFAGSFWPQFAPYIRTVGRYEADRLRNRGETRAIAFALETLTGGLPDIRIKIYTPKGLIVYSPDATEIGTVRAEASDLFGRALQGEAASKLESEDEDGQPRHMVETYIPAVDASGDVEGVFELYSDVTAEIVRVHRDSIQLVILISTAFLVLYGVLFLIVHRADRILRHQHTDILQREEEVRESEEKFRSVAQSASDAIISADAEGVIISWNHGAERMFGHTEVEAVGKPVTIIIPKRYRSAHRGGIARHAETGATGHLGEHLEFEGLRADGTEFPLELVLSRWHMRGGYYFTAIARDITERKQSEEQLHKTLDELVRSNAELERFAFVASHDLQEPVRTLVCYSQVLERRLGDRLEGDTRDYLDFVTDGAKRLQTLIRDLLAYSRVNHQDSPFTDVDAAEALSAARDNLAALIEENEAVIETGALPLVHGNPVQVSELFQNLIANGIKFAYPGRRPHIRIAAVPQDERWVFAVTDNGIGIEPDYFQQIFTIFKRLHTAHAYPGTGVGLAICKRIVERHGGRIWVDSEPDKGSTFYFTLEGTDVEAAE